MTPTQRKKWVVAYSTREGAPQHEVDTNLALARWLAQILGLKFGGSYDPQKHAGRELYLLPTQTLVGPAQARALNVKGPEDLWGGYVDHDFICTNVLNFMVDHENHLHIVAQMRSMDAVWGYRADYSMWDYVMDKMVADLNNKMIKYWGEITRGDISFQVANLHVYPRHFDLLDRWAHKIYDDQERRMRRQWMERYDRERLEAADRAAQN